MSSPHRAGQRLSYDGALCTVKYVGAVAGTTGTWLGVEWDDPARGKHDGCHKGVRYFSCLSKSPTAASFVRPSRPADPPRHFIEAVTLRYTSEYTLSDGRRAAEDIIFFGKAAEEVGFEKIRSKQANISELKIVIVEDLQIASALAEGAEKGTIARACPKITQLDVTRNLFDRLGPVADICRELPGLNSLRINGNRFQDILEDESTGAFDGVKELFAEETIMTWPELCHIAAKCPSLEFLVAGSNQLHTLPAVDYRSLSSTLTSLTLEFNDFQTLADLSAITPLTQLRNLHLKGNNITALAPEGSKAPVFPPSLEYLDVSYNKIDSWTFIDDLTKHIPGLKNLRISHNPVYDDTPMDASNVSSSEESHMFAIARIGGLKILNFSKITDEDRTNAEMFYLSRIGKQLSAVAETEEEGIIALHPRYHELVEIYGEPIVVRRLEVNPAFLEARLVNVGFHLKDGPEKAAKIPNSVDIYAVKGIAGKMFDMSPLRLNLVWETGEWDPVAGFDDQEGDSSDEEEAEEERERQDAAGVHAAEDGPSSKPGRWVKREVALKDGPRQLGYCVDGLDVRIRVEAR